jgi:hypothetical protein
MHFTPLELLLLVPRGRNVKLKDLYSRNLEWFCLGV